MARRTGKTDFWRRIGGKETSTGWGDNDGIGAAGLSMSENYTLFRVIKGVKIGRRGFI